MGRLLREVAHPFPLLRVTAAHGGGGVRAGPVLAHLRHLLPHPLLRPAEEHLVRQHVHRANDGGS